MRGLRLRGLTPPARSAFTLVELLVVLLIIAVLGALAAAGTFQFIETQRNNNTHTTMHTIDRVLQSHWSKVIADAQKEDPSEAVRMLAGTDPRRAKVIWVYFRLVEAFPKDFDEIRAPLLYRLPDPTSAYIPRQRHRHIPTYARSVPPAGNGNTSACLLLTLSQNLSGSSLKPDQIPSNIADTDNDGVKELVDDWGNPFRFERFPSNPELDALNPAARGSRADKLRDPLDPDGWLNPQKGPWNPAPFELITGLRITTNPNFNMYRLPTLMSTGRSTTDPNDDIYSFRLRLGKRGD